ncbi:hypothetical protein RFI_05690, partial [Reticulomyxa filosa]
CDKKEEKKEKKLKFGRKKFFCFYCLISRCNQKALDNKTSNKMTEKADKPTAEKGGAAEYHYFPFNIRLQQKHKATVGDGAKRWGNRGIAVGLKWRKGYPATRIGRHSGSYFVAGNKEKKPYHKYLKRLQTKMERHRVRFFAFIKTQTDTNT